MTQQDILLDTRPKNYLGSSLLFVGIFSTATIAGFFILITTPFSFALGYWVSKVWCIVVLKMAKWFCGIEYQVEGLENVEEVTGIVFCNHQSAWETLAVRAILPRHQATLLKRSLTWFPIWGWALAILKSISIDRDKPRDALRQLLTQGKTYLEEGLFLVIYPEGTRTAAGQVEKFNAGGSMLAQQTGFPVIPIAHNAGDFWPRYSFFKYKGVIKVKIGKPILTQGRKASEINNEAEQWIRTTVAQITTITTEH